MPSEITTGGISLAFAFHLLAHWLVIEIQAVRQR
jgi:hypothetical protein